MKIYRILFYFIFIYFLTSCSSKQKNYKDFTYEFNTIPSFNYNLESDLKKLINKKRKINIKQYSSLLDKNPRLKSLLSDQFYSLGILQTKINDKPIDIFLLESNDRIYILSGANQKLVDGIYLKPKTTLFKFNEMSNQPHFYAHKIKKGMWNVYPNIDIYSEIIFRINSEGNIFPKDGNIDYKKTYSTLPKTNKISGLYVFEDEKYKVEIDVRDGITKREFSARYKTYDKPNTCSFESYTINGRLNENRIYAEKDNNSTTLKYEFKNGKIDFFLNICSDSHSCYNIQCDFRKTLIKEKKK